MADRWRARIPRIYSVALTLIGLFCALQALVSPFRRVARPVRDFVGNVFIPASGNLAYAAVVLLVAAAIARRKRIAWRILAVILGLTLLSELLVGVLLAFSPSSVTDSGTTLNRGQAALITGGSVLATGIVFLVLLWARREFYAPVRHASFRRAVGVLVGFLAVGVLIGWGLVAAFPGTITAGAGGQLVYAAQKVLGDAFHFTSSSFGRAPGWVTLLLGLIGAIAVLAAFATLLGSQRTEARLPAADEQRIRELLARNGERDSLGYFATRRDKSAVFSAERQGGRDVPRRQRREPGQRRPDRGHRGMGPGDRRLAGNQPEIRMGTRRDGRERGGRRRVPAGRPRRTANWATRRSCTWTSSPSPGETCGRSGRRSTGWSGPATRSGSRRHDRVCRRRTWRRPSGSPNEWRDTDSERGFSMALGRLGDPGRRRVRARGGPGRHRDAEGDASR